MVITDSGRAEVMTLMTPMFRGLAEIGGSSEVATARSSRRYLRGAIDAMQRLLG